MLSAAIVIGYCWGLCVGGLLIYAITKGWLD